jgi:hypothetical protein
VVGIEWRDKVVGIEWRDKGGVSLNERGEAVNGRGDMRGKKHSRGELFGILGGRENYFDIRRLYWSIFRGRDWKTVFLVFGLRNLVDCYRGASVAGSFGLGGQESLRNPGAREPDRLCS